MCAVLSSLLPAIVRRSASWRCCGNAYKAFFTCSKRIWWSSCQMPPSSTTIPNRTDARSVWKIRMSIPSSYLSQSQGHPNTRRWTQASSQPGIEFLSARWTADRGPAGSQDFRGRVYSRTKGRVSSGRRIGYRCDGRGARFCYRQGIHVHCGSAIRQRNDEGLCNRSSLDELIALCGRRDGPKGAEREPRLQMPGV